MLKNVFAKFEYNAGRGLFELEILLGESSFGIHYETANYESMFSEFTSAVRTANTSELSTALLFAHETVTGF